MSVSSSVGTSQSVFPRELLDTLERIKQQTCFFAWKTCPPPTGFDPRTADDALLAKYGLPPKPDEAQFPLRYAFWKKMLSRADPQDSSPVEFVLADFVYEAVERSPGQVPVLLPPPARWRSPIPRRIGRGVAARDTSVNWCGAYVTAHDGRIITEIHGSWKVPNVDVPAGTALASLDEGDELRCSSWLGLDGQRGYVDASLPQIGTSHFVKKTGAKDRELNHGVWWQWWLRDVPNPPPIKLPLDVKPGDEIMASLFVVDSSYVTYLIANHTTGQVCTPFMTPEPTSYLPEPLPAKPVWVSGATGEWITERPVNWTTGEPDDLPFFEQVVFKDCLIVLGRAPRVDEREERPAGTLLIRATRVDEAPPRTVTVARARRRRGNSFSTTFLGTKTRERGGMLSVGPTPALSTGSTVPPSIGSAPDPAAAGSTPPASVGTPSGSLAPGP